MGFFFCDAMRALILGAASFVVKQELPASIRRHIYIALAKGSHPATIRLNACCLDRMSQISAKVRNTVTPKRPSNAPHISSGLVGCTGYFLGGRVRSKQAHSSHAVQSADGVIRGWMRQFPGREPPWRHIVIREQSERVSNRLEPLRFQDARGWRAPRV
jgi:hypothetical protein